MTDPCCCPPEAGNAVCEVAKQHDQPIPFTNVCPVCRTRGKRVQGQTIKSLLSVSLREVKDVEYLFCKTQTCPVVYFSPDGAQTFTVAQIRESVYQKESNRLDVFVCYCFRYKVGDILTATPEARNAIVDDINTGINSGQCACDLRNPQGSCCLGNVRGLIKDNTAIETDVVKTSE